MSQSVVNNNLIDEIKSLKQRVTNLERMSHESPGQRFSKTNEIPAVSATETVLLFSRDNGSGKMEICVQFPSGEVQAIKTES